MMQCPLCSSTRFRVSKFRSMDIPLLFQFRYPIRCRNCYERTTTSLFRAYLLHRADKRRRRQGSRDKNGLQSPKIG